MTVRFVLGEEKMAIFYRFGVDQRTFFKMSSA